MGNAVIKFVKMLLTLLEKNIKLFTYLFDANALITWCKTKSALCCSKELSAWTAWTKAGKSSGQSLGTSYLAILPIERRKEYSVYWINWPQGVAPCRKFCKFCFLSFQPCSNPLNGALFEPETS